MKKSNLILVAIALVAMYVAALISCEWAIFIGVAFIAGMFIFNKDFRRTF